MSMLFMLLASFYLAQADGAKEGIAGYPILRDHVVFVTNKEIYLLRREGLTPEQQTAFEKIGAPVSVSLSRTSIEYSWPNVSFAENTPPDNFSGSQTDSIRFDGNTVQMKGKSLPAYVDQYYFFQINSWIYRVEKAALTDDQKVKLGNSGQIEVVVPSKSISFAWKANGTEKANRAPASMEQDQDVVLKTGETFFIRGRILYSFNDSNLLIQSNNTIFDIRKSRLNSGACATSCESPGKRISLEVPSSAIDMSWDLATDKDTAKWRVAKKSMRRRR